MSEINLEVPAREDFLHLLRTVISSAATRANFSIDEIDDIRIAVDEAASHLLQLPPLPSTLKLTIDVSENELRSTVWAESDAEWPPSAFQESLSWKILMALTDSVEFLKFQENPAIHFRKARREVPDDRD